MNDRMKEIATKPFEPQEEYRAELIESIPEISLKLEDLINLCFGLGLTAGWWHDAATKEPKPNRNFGDIVALIHSEISEAFEAHRKNAPDDHLPEYPGKIVELADAMIRIFDYVGSTEEMREQFMNAFRDKLIYNTKRKDHKMDARAADGGKKL